MARIAGITLPSNKRVEIALTYIYGIGPTTAERILKEAGVDASIRVKDLTEDQATKLRDIIEKQQRLTPSR